MTCRLTPLMLGYFTHFNDLPASFDSVLYHFGSILSSMDCLDMSATYLFGRAHPAFFLLEFLKWWTYFSAVSTFFVLACCGWKVELGTICANNGVSYFLEPRRGQ